MLTPKNQQPGLRNTSWDPSGYSHPKSRRIPAVTHPYAHFSLQERMWAGSESRSPLGDPHLPQAGTAHGDCFSSPGASQGWEPGTENSQFGRWQHTGAPPGAGGTRDKVGGCTPSAPRSEGATGSRRAPTSPPPHPSASRTGTLLPRSGSRAPHAQNTPSEKTKSYLYPRDGWGRAGERQGWLGGGGSRSRAGALSPARYPPGSARPPDFLPLSRPFPSQTQSLLLFLSLNLLLPRPNSSSNPCSFFSPSAALSLIRPPPQPLCQLLLRPNSRSSPYSVSTPASAPSLPSP